MKNAFLVSLSAMIFMCAFSGLCFATTHDTFQCPNGAIISVNDKLVTVAMRCDPPTISTVRMVTGGYWDYPRMVEVEEWVYNRGPGSFVYYLTFENGVLRRIESGAYGN